MCRSQTRAVVSNGGASSQTPGERCMHAEQMREAWGVSVRVTGLCSISGLWLSARPKCSHKLCSFNTSSWTWWWSWLTWGSVLHCPQRLGIWPYDARSCPPQSGDQQNPQQQWQPCFLGGTSACRRQAPWRQECPEWCLPCLSGAFLHTASRGLKGRPGTPVGKAARQAPSDW